MTPVCLAVGGRVAAVLGVGDHLRPEATAVVAELQRLGVEVHMLSGDAEATCRGFAALAGIRHVHGEVMPAQKAAVVEALRAAGHVVAMVGDGINDAPALAVADVGVGIGAGTDVAVETADVVLMRSDLADLLVALDLARRTMRRVRQNFAWAFGYNLVAIPLAAGLLVPIAGVALPPAAAGFSELLSSIPVVLFSLLLRRYRPPRLGGPSDGAA